MSRAGVWVGACLALEQAVGCSFPTPPQDIVSIAADASSDVQVDARPDASPDARMVDAPPRCMAGFIDLCAAAPRSDSLRVVGTNIDEIHTDYDPRCVDKPQANGPPLCLLYFESILIESGANLRVYGGRGVILAARTSLTIDGMLDVSTRRTRLFAPGAGHGRCVTSQLEPEADVAGGGGGAGGAFGRTGGGGGIGDRGSLAGGDGDAKGGQAAPALSQVPAILRGGCQGQSGGMGGTAGVGGEGGPSGGAAYLFAKGPVIIRGRILATGAGGQGGAGGASGYGGGGGGGGGSGGMVVIESETSTRISGYVLTSGGGAGAGGRAGASGGDGADGEFAEAPPGGGDLAVPNSGAGGAGATFLGANPVAAMPGQTGNSGGGGGGGGTGFIVVRGPMRDVVGTLVPPAVMP